MLELSRICAATDLSVPARHAAERAAQLSQSTGIPLDLLHVADLGPLARLRQLMGARSAELETRLLATAREKLAELATALQQRFDVVATTQVVTGPLMTALAGHAPNSDHGLLVCGSQGEGQARPSLLGSTAWRVLSHTAGPVLVVKRPTTHAYRRVLVAVDFSTACMRALQHAHRLVPQAEFLLLHVFEIPFEGKLRYASVDEDTIRHYREVAQQEAMQKLQDFRNQVGLSPQTTRLQVMHGEPSARIAEQALESQCELLVMGKNSQNKWDDWLLGGVTRQVLNTGHSDVLVSAGQATDTAPLS